MQVTDLIFKVLYLSNAASSKAMQELQDQKPDRQHILNRLLEKDISMPPVLAQSTNEIIIATRDESEESATEDGDDESSEDGDDGSGDEGLINERPQQLNGVVAFLTQGVSFNQFKGSLRRFVYPPTTIQEALADRNFKAVRKVLRERFDLIAEGEYSWLREWDEMGCSRDEIAEFLLEDANDSPWIYFESGKVPRNEIQLETHITGCVHQICSSDVLPADRFHLPSIFSGLMEGNDIRRIVQELCGLAGIVPISRDLEKWTGSVRFEEENSVAIVSYALSTDQENPNHHALVCRIIRALQNFCIAIGQVQVAGLCCSCFTVLRHHSEDHNFRSSQQTRLELWRMDLEPPVRLLEELKSLLLLDNIVPSNALQSQNIAIHILKSLAKDLTISLHTQDVDDILHLCSLAVQFLCLGFLSYSQAHIGALQPFFLDSPQRKIYLMGSRWFKNSGYVTAELRNLTCIGRMTRGPVLAFSMVQTNSPTLSENEIEHDLLTSAEDLLNTWGPGKFIIRKDFEENPCGIEIGGGIICAADNSGKAFHWSRH